MSLFTKEGEIAARSVHYIKIFTAMIIPLAVQYPLVDETTALGQVRLALFCSAFRKVIYLGSLLLLPALFTAEAAFFSEPAADVAAAVMTTCLFLSFFPRVIAKRKALMEEPAEKPVEESTEESAEESAERPAEKAAI